MVVILFVNLLRTRAFDYAWRIAVIAGGVIYILVILAGDFCLSITVAMVPMILSTVISVLAGFVLEFFVFGGDYSRTERLEYEDDEYYYYVKAVPKFNVTKAQRCVTYIRNEKKKEPDLTDEELDALANLGHTEESGNSRDLDEIEKKEEIEEINETEEIQEEEIPPLDEGDYQDVDYKSMLEDTLKDL